MDDTEDEVGLGEEAGGKGVCCPASPELVELVDKAELGGQAPRKQSARSSMTGPRLCTLTIRLC